MDELANLCFNLERIAESIKLPFGSVDLMIRQLDKISNAQDKLREIKDNFEICSAIVFKKDTNTLVESAVKKHPQNHEEFENLKQRVHTLIEQIHQLKNLAETCLSEPRFIECLQQRKEARLACNWWCFCSLEDRLTKLGDSVEATFAFGNPNLIQEQVKQITQAKEELQRIKIRLKEAIDIIDENVTILTPDSIRVLVSLLGEYMTGVGFSYTGEIVIKYLDSKEAKICDLQKQFSHFSQTVDELILQAQRQEEFGMEYLSKLAATKRHLEEGHKDEENSQCSQDKKPVGISITKLKVLLTTLVSIVLTCAGWTTQVTFSQVQQTAGKQPLLALKSSEQKPNPEEQAQENKAAAKKLALEAAILVQNPPHSQVIWQQAKEKWQQAIHLLEAIPPGTLSTNEVENLAQYRTNYATISQRLLTEQQAAANLDAAQKLAWEASLLVQNPPHPQAVWQQAKDKWQQAINLLTAIPQGTFAFIKAKEKLVTYRMNYANVNKQILASE